MVYCKSAACTGVCRRVPAVRHGDRDRITMAAECPVPDGRCGRSTWGPGMIAARVTIGHRVAVCDEGTVAQCRTQVGHSVEGNLWSG